MKGIKLRTFCERSVIPAGGLIEGLAPVNILVVHIESLRHVGSHRVLIGPIIQLAYRSRNIRDLPTNPGPEQVTERLKHIPDLLIYVLRCRQVDFFDVVEDIEWVAGYGGVLVVDASVVEEQECVRWVDHIHDVRNKLHWQVSIPKQIEDPVHEWYIWEPHSSNVLYAKISTRCENTGILHT